MKYEQYRIEYGQHSIDYTVVRKDRKTLEIAVEPDLTVFVAAPTSAACESIQTKVRKRAAWILRQQRYFEQFNPRKAERCYVSGETHLYLGRQDRLRVVRSELSAVKLLYGRIIVQTGRPENHAETKRLLDEWYIAKARMKFLERIEACVQHFSRPASVTPNGLIIRAMKKRWGSMSNGKRLLLNVRLVQAPLDTIDYVITHELCHIIELSHSPKFYRVMSRAMPDWERRKDKLERFLG